MMLSYHRHKGFATLVNIQAENAIICVLMHSVEFLMAEWLGRASQGHEMYCLESGGHAS